MLFVVNFGRTNCALNRRLIIFRTVTLVCNGMVQVTSSNGRVQLWGGTFEPAPSN